MDEKEILKKTEDFVQDKLSGESSGHDWWHVYRVWKMAVYIGTEEKANLFVVQLSALLHDIADWKFHEGDENIGSEIAKEWLEKLKVNPSVIAQVCEIIKDISFKGAGVKTQMQTKEGMIVQDADRLDAIGAIGIARTFAYGGHKNREMYNPDIKYGQHNSFEEYKNNKGTSINHFYEKLLLLKDRMNTKTGQRIAEERHKFMEFYLAEFYKEWDGGI